MSSVEEIANAAIDACESSGIDYMVTGALAFNYYAVPRATKDVDLVIDMSSSDAIAIIIDKLRPKMEFEAQAQFDTLTWGRRHVGRPIGHAALSLELFELFDDEFVRCQFGRRREYESTALGRAVQLPTAEDIIVQKLRWARPKDLEDARDVIAVQQPINLDLPYIEEWCLKHGSFSRFRTILDALPEF